MTQPRKRPGCLMIGCGGFIFLGLLGALLPNTSGGTPAQVGQGSSVSRPAPVAEGADHGELLTECEAAVKARLNFPDEAEFTSAFSVGLNGEIQDSGDLSVWRSQVKGKNAFGVRSTIGFVCSKNRNDSTVQLVMQE